MNNNKDNSIKRNPLSGLANGLTSLSQRLCVLACIIFYSLLMMISSPALAAELVTNTATANFSINGTPYQVSDSVQFTKDAVVPPSDVITLTKQADVTDAFIGDAVTYTLTVTNPNDHTQNNVSIIDIIPANINYQLGSATLNGTNLNASQVSITANQLSFILGSIPANAVWTINYNATVAASGVAINTATAKTDSATSLQVSSAVNVTTRTPSTIKFLKISDTGVSSIIPPTSYNDDQSGGKHWQEVYTITLPDGTTITLPTPQPIIDATHYSLLDPIIIEVTDLDQNVNSTLIDTIIVEVEVPGTGDKEILLLQETSPNSGIFRGVLRTTSSTTNTQNGVLSLVDGSKINVHYRDESDSTDTSATAALIVPNTSIALIKTADKSEAAIGELVKYSLTFTNNTNSAIPNLNIIDTLPLGFRYIPNTARLNGTILNTDVISNGRNINFNLGNMATGQIWTLEYLTKITAGVQVGNAINTAYVDSGSIQSAKAHATVIIKDDLMRSKNILTGRVYIGCTTGKNAKTLKDARIITETGRSVLTDEEGFWHMEGIQAGTHVLQLDEISLPTGYKPLLCEENTRFAGNPASQFVNLQTGVLWHADFYVKKTAPSYKTVPIYKDVPVYSEKTIRTPYKKVLKILKLSEKEIFFELDSDKLTAEAQTKLQEVVENIHNRGIGRGSIMITGNACGLGAPDYDQRLSDRRGQSVRNFLEKHGINPKSLINNALGNTKQKYPDTDEQRYKNRRVDIKFQTGYETDKTAYRTEIKKVQTGTRKVLTKFIKTGKNSLITDDSLDNEDVERKEYNEVNPFDLYGKNYLESASNSFEILWPKNNYVPAVASTKIFIKSSPQHKVEVFLNGKKVSPLNYDGSATNKARTVTIRRWKGVDIDIKNRNNRLLVIYKDKSGKELGRKTHNIHFSGEATSAKFLAKESKLVADGKTIPIIALLPRDKDGFRLRTGSHGYFSLENNRFQVKTLSSTSDTLNLNESLAGNYKYYVDADGIARIALNPTTQSGKVELNLKFPEGKNKTIKVWLKPQLRDWILVGLAEGTLAHNTLSGNMSSLTELDKSDTFSKRGRVSFYAQGKVKGKYLLTVAYDTHKAKQEVGSQLNGNIDPDAWYTIYGDNSNSQYNAPSSRKLYLKLEKDNFYALFGDYNTGMNITELAKYERVLNGIKTEYNGEKFSYNAFISETSNKHQHEEIPGDGTSGLYHLASDIVANSETIKLETRDRFHSERILESRVLTRYQDYEIDYASGALFFKFPITGRDGSFNPQFIVIDYDSETDNNKEVVLGGRIATKINNEKLEVGLSTIMVNRNNTKNDSLIALDANYKLTSDTKLHVEVAQSKTAANNFKSANAEIIELEKEIANMEARIYYRKQDKNFGIVGQASESNTKKIGANIRYDINDKTSLNAEVSQQRNLDNDNKRDLAEISVKQQYKQLEMSIGVRHSKEKLTSDTVTNDTVLAGARYTTKNGRVTYRANIEENINSSSIEERSPNRRILGVDLKINNGMSIFAEHEQTDNHSVKTQNLRVGVNKSLWAGAKARSTYTKERTDQGQRDYATLGLSQQIKISKHLNADISIDHAKTISGTQQRFNADEPLNQGSQRDDYTALSVGLGSQIEDWSWSGRFEIRDGDLSDKLNLQVGLIHHIKDGRQVSAKFSHTETDFTNGNLEQNTKLSLGTAWHPKEKAFVFFSRLDLIDEKSNTADNGASTNSHTQKIIHNMHYNRKFNDQKTQVSLHHGIKHVINNNNENKHSTTIDTGTVEIRHDINKKWDIGARAGYLRDWKEDTTETVAGISIGMTPAKNAWIELGYNFEGFNDEDFDNNNFKQKGAYTSFRYKFNQDSFGGKDLPIRRVPKEKDTELKRPDSLKDKKNLIDSNE